MAAPKVSISLAEKPTAHLSLEAWHAGMHDIQQNAEGTRNHSNLLRNGATQTRNEANINSFWARHKSTVQITDRITEVEEWHHVLDSLRRLLEEEVEKLDEERSSCELQMEAYYRALNVVAECLLGRDGRCAGDLSYDEPYNQLHAERKLLDDSKAAMTEKCMKGWEMIMEGRDLISRLKHNVAEKSEAIQVDNKALELTMQSPVISNKPDSQRDAQGISSYEAWMNMSQALRETAEARMGDYGKMREELRLTRDKSKTEYLCQVETTNYALRKRIHEVNRLKNELLWQRKNTQEEMCKVQAEIGRLKDSASEHDALLKCAETRQESRNMRPVPELARDYAHEGLLEEITYLRATLRTIREKIDQAICTQNALESLMVRLDSEIHCKELSIQVDMRVLDSRCNLVEHRPQATLDKDTVLVKMEKQLPAAPLC